MKMKFNFGDNVKVVSGFYAKARGTIEDYKKDSSGMTIYKVDLILPSGITGRFLWLPEGILKADKSVES